MADPPSSSSSASKRSSHLSKESSDFDVTKYLSLLQEVENGSDLSNEQEAALKSFDITEKHVKRAKEVVDTFLQILSEVRTEDNKLKWETMVEEVPNPNYIPGDPESSETINHLFVVLSGIKTRAKVQLFNRMLVDYLLRLKKKCTRPGTVCEFYSPNTQNTMVRILLGRLKKVYGFDYKFKDFENYEGCAAGVIKTLYAQRQEKYVSELL